MIKSFIGNIKCWTIIVLEFLCCLIIFYINWLTVLFFLLVKFSSGICHRSDTSRTLSLKHRMFKQNSSWWYIFLFSSCSFNRIFKFSQLITLFAQEQILLMIARHYHFFLLLNYNVILYQIWSSLNSQFH